MKLTNAMGNYNERFNNYQVSRKYALKKRSTAMLLVFHEPLKS